HRLHVLAQERRHRGLCALVAEDARALVLADADHPHDAGGLVVARCLLRARRIPDEREAPRLPVEAEPLELVALRLVLEELRVAWPRLLLVERPPAIGALRALLPRPFDVVARLGPERLVDVGIEVLPARAAVDGLAGALVDDGGELDVHPLFAEAVATHATDRIVEVPPRAEEERAGTALHAREHVVEHVLERLVAHEPRLGRDTALDEGVHPDRAAVAAAAG